MGEVKPALASTLDLLSSEPGAALVVDLDDTLLCTDALHEQILQLVRANPAQVFFLPFWLAFGLVKLKTKVAEATHLEPARLPYRASVVALIKQARDQGRRVVLASASHSKIVEAVSRYLGTFDMVVATERENMSGPSKLRALQQILAGGSFIYIGDSRKDLVVWQKAVQIFAVNPSASVERRIKALGKPYQIEHDRVGLLRLVVKQMRMSQWVKNALLFVPLIAAHSSYPSQWLEALLAAIAFSFLASGVYVMNDMLDVEADRTHRAKQCRPFASGQLPLKAGLILLPALLIPGVLLVLPLGKEVCGMFLLYLATNIAYSFKLKEVVLVDTVMLAGFYTLRILAGAAASHVHVSSWLLSFSIFFFFGLAMVKRYSELTHGRGQSTVDRQGYVYSDKFCVYSMGVVSSFLAILTMVLYLHSPHVTEHYRHSERLWLAAPLLLYWTGRLWLRVHRDEVNDDPVIYAIKDLCSWCVLGSFGVLMACSL